MLVVKKEYGYKRVHSTEMLLVWVSNYLLEACDKNVPKVELLLDLSAAFDSVDHEKLLSILKHEIGVTGVTHEWYRNFLMNGTHRVKVGDGYSEVDL